METTFVLGVPKSEFLQGNLWGKSISCQKKKNQENDSPPEIYSSEAPEKGVFLLFANYFHLLDHFLAKDISSKRIPITDPTSENS